MKIMSIVGARPNFVKIAPLITALRRYPLQVEHCLVHTGQHYDQQMSGSLFDGLHLPQPDVVLGVGSGTHAEQVGRTMIAFEKVVQERKPDWVVVVGDVNATCACSITAKKEQFRVAHIEAGLRSFDLSMPEEINRMVTDRMSDLLFTTDAIADGNLLKEGVPGEQIKRVGNIMIDAMETHRAAAEALDLNRVLSDNKLARSHGGRLVDDGYAVLTLHRPSNVDAKAILDPLLEFFMHEVSVDMPLVWPVHPRTEKRMREFGLYEKIVSCAGIVLCRPVGYLEMLRLNMSARVMFTDSGGLQEECCVLGTPCLTLRENTERPVTLLAHGGTSTLVGNDRGRIREEYAGAKQRERRESRPALWDGKTAERIAAILKGHK